MRLCTRMPGPKTPGLEKTGLKQTAAIRSQPRFIWQVFLSPYYVLVSMKYTSPMLFHLIIQPTLCCGDYCYLSRTNEQVGKPGQGNGFPQGISLLPKCSIEPRSESKVGVLSCRSFSKESRHKNDSASRPYPQVVHRRAMGKVNGYVTTV